MEYLRSNVTFAITVYYYLYWYDSLQYLYLYSTRHSLASHLLHSDEPLCTFWNDDGVETKLKPSSIT